MLQDEHVGNSGKLREARDTDSMLCLQGTLLPSRGGGGSGWILVDGVFGVRPIEKLHGYTQNTEKVSS